MINNTRQSWTPGSTVKVGFMSLTVLRAIPTPGDYLPDAYILEAKGRYYRFVPHNGLERIDETEALAA